MSQIIPITVVIEPALITAHRLAELLDLISDYAPILETIGGIIEEEIAEGFDSQGWGTWAPLKAATWRDKDSAGYSGQPELVRSGNLYRALTQRDAPGHKFLVSRDSVMVGVYGDVIPYAHYLETGTARMPGRVLCQLRDQGIQRLIDAVQDWLGADGVHVYQDAPLTFNAAFGRGGPYAMAA